MSLRYTLRLCLAMLLGLPALASAGENELTRAEKAEGYKLLFNGKDLLGWHRTSSGFGGWGVEDGALCLRKGGGMIYADGEYDNFILKLEFKMSPGCNSGVFFRVGDPRNEVQTGLEVQIQDDFGKKPNRNSVGSIYDLVAPAKNTVKPAGEWNNMVITANKNIVIVELNDEKITEINLDEWDRPGMRPDGSKHKYKLAVKDFPRKGLIGFQDHGKPVCYRNIKLKSIK